MKRLVLLIIVFASIKAYSQQIKFIEIHSVPMLTETDYDVPCDQNFDITFKKFLIVKKITDKSILRKIDEFIHAFKRSNDKTIDVRGQIKIFYKNGKSKVICFGKFGNFRKDNSYFTSAAFFKFLQTNHYIQEF